MNKSMLIRQKGFTLIEIILIMALVGILVAIAMPRLGGKDFFAKLELRTASHQVASDIRYARRLAITDSIDYVIDFDTKNNTYGIYKEKVLAANLVGEMKQVPSSISLSGDSRFTFERLGNAAAGGTLTLNAGTGGKYQYNITVETISGIAVMEKIS